MKQYLRKGVMHAMLSVAAISLMFIAFAPPVSAAKPKLSKSKAVLIKGQTLKLKVKNYKKAVKWSSSSKKTAKVKKGKVTALKKGKATITAKAGKAKLKCKITIETPSISSKTETISAGDTITLKLKGASGKVKWKSNNTKAATVSQKGVVAAKGAGTAVITATYLKKKFKCTVTVKAKSASLQDQVDAAAAATKGKIAIITVTKKQGEEEYYSAELMVKKYGSDRITHDTLPDNFMEEIGKTISVISKYGKDPDYKALIINQAVPGCNEGVDQVLKTRKKDDLLVVYCTPQENAADVSKRADIILNIDEIGKGTRIAEQAYRMGCKTIVHYSIPRHMAQAPLAGCRDKIEAKCKEYGIKFVSANAVDPVEKEGIDAAVEFIREDVPKKVSQYGKDTCFFTTNCALQPPLIKAVHDCKAYYALPCCPSPYHGFPDALGIEMPEDPVKGLEPTINAITKKLHNDGLDGHFSTWKVPVNITNTVAATEYAFLWMNGDVTKCNSSKFKALISDYCGSDITLSVYKESGKTYSNYLLYLEDFLNFGEPTRAR